MTDNDVGIVGRGRRHQIKLDVGVVKRVQARSEEEGGGTRREEREPLSVNFTTFYSSDAPSSPPPLLSLLARLPELAVADFIVRVNHGRRGGRLHSTHFVLPSRNCASLDVYGMHLFQNFSRSRLVFSAWAQ